MSSSFVAALWITFALCTMVCLITEHQYLDTDPTGVQSTVLGLINIPYYTTSTGIAPIAFPALVLQFFQALWKILTWDYSFWKLNPVLQIVKIVFCYPITIFAIWGLIQMFAGFIKDLG